MKSGKLVSGSNGDKKIKFWDLNNYSKIKTFSNINSTQYNNCLIEVDNNIFVGEKNGIRIFTIKNNLIEDKFYEDNDLERVLALYYLGNNIIIAGSTTGFIYLYKIRENNEIITLENINVFRNNPKAIKGNHDYSVSCLLYLNNLIISGSIDGLINCYKYKNK